MKQIKLFRIQKFMMLFLISPMFAYAQPMQCHTTTNGTTVDLKVIPGQRGLEAMISVERNNYKLSGHYYNLTQLWDGHMTGLMTNEAISIKYDNSYGNIRNVSVMAYASMDGKIGMGNGWIQDFYFEKCVT